MSKIRINKYWRHKDYLILLIRHYRVHLGCTGQRELLRFIKSKAAEWLHPWTVKVKRKGKRK